MPSSRLAMATVVSLLALSVPGHAQVAADRTPPGDDTIILSPFEITSDKDFGYRPASSVTATGTAGLIKDTPMNISVLSRELIDDQGGNQLVDVLRAASSVALHVKDESVVLVRGFTGPKFLNGMPAGQGITLYDIDRVEVVKGPNAVFAGLSSPGGTVNLIQNKPNFTPTGSLSLEFGSYDRLRTVFRTSGPLIADKLAYQFTYGATDENSATDYMFTDERYYSGGLTFKPFDRLTLTARYGDLEREAGRRPYLTVSHPLFQQMDKEAIALYDSKGLARPADYPQLENGAVKDSSGAPITTGRGSPEDVSSFIARRIGPNEPPFPMLVFDEITGSDTSNYNGPEGRDNYWNKTFNLEAELVATDDLAARIVYQQNESSRMRREFNGFRPVAGQRFRSGASDFAPATDDYSIKGEVTYKLDLAAAGTHNLLAGYQYDDGKIVNRAGAGSATINYNPRTDPVPRLLGLIQQAQGPGYTEPPTTKTSAPANRGTYGVIQSSFFGDRLRTMVGGRYVEAGATDVSDFVSQYSALFRLAPSISVYGSRSETFVPESIFSADLDAIRASQGDPTSPGYVPPATVPQKLLQSNITGEGYEFGFKFDFNDSQWLATVSYFETQESNRLQVDTVTQTLYQLPGGSVRTPSGLTRARGIEGEITWTPSGNLQMLLSGSYYLEAEEITNVSDSREVGTPFEAVPDYNVNLWGKYTFTTGRLKGAYVGGGFNLLGPFSVHPSWTVTVQSDAVVVVDALVGYATTFRDVPVDFRVNLKNLTDEKYLNGSFQYGEPLTVVGTVTVRW